VGCALWDRFNIIILNIYSLTSCFNLFLADRKCESQRKQEGIKKQNNSTKILIRNIPFEATRAEIQQLFGFVNIEII